MAYLFGISDQSKGKTAKWIIELAEPLWQESAFSCRTGRLSGFPISSGYEITTPDGILNWFSVT